MTHLPARPDLRLRPTVCMANRSKPESVTMRTSCPITRPDDPHVKCQTITGRLADTITRQQAAAGHRCSSVCLCLD